MFLNILNWLKSPNYLRPPGALPEEDFIKQCIHCGKCAQVCPYDSISFIDNPISLSQGTPIIKAREIPCYVCMKCPEVCPTGALDRFGDSSGQQSAHWPARRGCRARSRAHADLCDHAAMAAGR